jgi:hypothetical protein
MKFSNDERSDYPIELEGESRMGIAMSLIKWILFLKHTVVFGSTLFQSTYWRFGPDADLYGWLLSSDCYWGSTSSIFYYLMAEKWEALDSVYLLFFRSWLENRGNDEIVICFPGIQFITARLRFTSGLALALRFISFQKLWQKLARGSCELAMDEFSQPHFDCTLQPWQRSSLLKGVSSSSSTCG